MSLHLGKIHYWLFNKIRLFELGEKNIIDWASKENLPVSQWQKEIYENYGMPLDHSPLEAIVDTANIHGWLQDKIQRAEIRYAYLVTKILKENQNYINNLLDIMEEKGNREGKEFAGNQASPEEIYNAINDYVVEGMPCDRINVVESSDQNQLVWKAARCLHKQYWDHVGGNVENYYKLRNRWIEAFVKSVNSEFSFENLDSNVYKIYR